MPSGGTVVPVSTLDPRGDKLYFNPIVQTGTSRRTIARRTRRNNEFQLCGAANKAGVYAFLNSNPTGAVINFNPESLLVHLEKLFFEFYFNGVLHTSYVVPLSRTEWQSTHDEITTWMRSNPPATPGGGISFACGIFGSEPTETMSTLYARCAGAGAATRRIFSLIQKVVIPEHSQINLVKIGVDQYLMEFDFVESMTSSGSPVLTPRIPVDIRNRLCYGAPGTGKSYTLEEEAVQLIGSGVTTADFLFKCAFNPSTSYGDFIGEYKPTMIYGNNLTTPSPISYMDRNGLTLPSPPPGDPTIEYAFVPGIFIRSYIMAKQNPNQPVVLFIDEVNRGDIYEIFGELFQLMERDQSATTPNQGKYSLPLSDEAMAYIRGELSNTDTEVRLPENFYLWATMNPNDASVQLIDSAFMRRWATNYYGINEGVVNSQTVLVLNCEWELLRTVINDQLTLNLYDEAQLIGKWFVNTQDCSTWELFYSKIIFHLANFVIKDNLSVLFKTQFNTVQEIMEHCKNNQDPFNEAVSVALSPPAPAALPPAALPPAALPPAALPPAPVPPVTEQEDDIN